MAEVYGPSIYTVNEQYIKPITRFHGKMSWALMRNPAGLDCDMFISHAWLEGIFEFLRKVLHSWPRGQGVVPAGPTTETGATGAKGNSN